MTRATVSRNDPCPCGSGKKYKQCCLKSGGVQASRKSRVARVLAIVVVIAALASGYLAGRDTAMVVGFGGALVVGVYLFVFSDPPPPTQGGNPGAINFGS